MLSEFHFLRPWWLLALLGLAGIVWLLARRQAGAGDWAEYCDEALMPYVLIGSPAKQSRLPLWLAGLTGLIAVLALAGPAWERLPTPVFRNLSAMVIVLDLSWAMEANDLKPNRLERARFKIDDLLRARKDGQTALLAYAGDAFVVTPLTDDAATISAQLTALSPSIMPVQGTRMDLGLAAAGRLLQQAGQKTGDVLVVTAGEDVASATAAASQLKSEGYRVSLIGVGSREGAPIPLAEGGFLKDSDGKMLLSRLDIKALWDLAQAGGGVYRTLDAGSADTDAVLEFVDRRAEADQQSGQDVHVDQWRDGGIWLLPLLIPLAAMGFRRGWLGLMVLAVLAPVPQPAEALEWADLWKTPDQQAQRTLQSGDAKAAAERFVDPGWKAAAEYKAGEYDEAAKRLEAIDTPLAQYNRGNALAQQGQLEAALKAYDRALQLNPSHEDAQFNRKLVEDALKKQQEQQPQKQDQSESSKDGEQGQQSKQDQQKQDGQKKPAESQDQKPEPSQAEQDKDQAGNKADEEKSAGENNESKDPAQASESQSGAGEDDPKKQAPESAGQEKPAEQESAQQETPADQAQPEEQATKDTKDKPAAAAQGPEPQSESDQAEAQWLRRIPDDPGGLLKRKFSYQYRLRQQQQSE
jgi:Ca-activated chloride channel family protein